jgi:DNA-binding transcriptional regulator YiaG
MNTSRERRKIDGEWVKALRQGLGLSQDELAERLGVSRSAVARWEADAFRPTMLAAKVLLALSDSVRESQATKAQGKVSPSIEQAVRHEPHSPRRRKHDSRPRRTPAP